VSWQQPFLDIEFLLNFGHIYYFLTQRRSIFQVWFKKLKNEKSADGVNNQNNAIAAARQPRSAGTAGAGFPSVRPACTKTSGG
jgi:hypothetical protein